MSIEQNKAIVRRYLTHFEKRETAAALGLLSDDLTWWILGKPHLYPYGGLKTKADIADIFTTLESLLEGWVEFTVLRLLAEGDWVAVEAESRGVAKTGKPYNNNFAFFFTLRDGKITAVREYFDLMHVIDAFTPAKVPEAGQ